MPDQHYADLGALAAALAKAQASFPAITRDKEVTVASKRTGATYKFKYAPLDKIIDKVRGPLADNGLAVTQLLDSDPDGSPLLVTMLLHSGGGSLTGRTPIPRADGDTAQEFGSAVTYLRRYALTALLGIATEDDDDGNRAAGNAVTTNPKEPPAYEQGQDGSIIGMAELGKGASDFELRQTPEGHALSFRLVSGRKSIQVTALDPLASALALVKDQVIGQRVQAWGRVADETFTPKGTSKKIPYQVLFLSRIQTPTLIIPAGTDHPSAPSTPLEHAGDKPNPETADAAGGMAEGAPQNPAPLQTAQAWADAVTSSPPLLESEIVHSLTTPVSEGAGGPPETAKAGPLPVVQAGVVAASMSEAAPLCGKPGPYSEGETCVLPRAHRGPHVGEDKATWL